MTTDKNFCPYYDQGLLIEATPAGRSKIAMCCFQARTEVDTISFDHPALTRLREEAKVNIPSICSTYCHVDDSIHNQRLNALNETWWNTAGQHIKKLHLKQGLICNLKCISCSSEWSSAWNSDYHYFDSDAPMIRAKKDSDESWNHLDLSQLTELHFDGGEPLLNPDSINILRHLDKLNLLSNVSLNYNTNGTIFPSNELIELWGKCKWVRIFFSLDGVGSTFEYTRYPARWNEVVANLYRFQQIKGPCLLIEVDAVVGIHNIFNLREFYDWWKNNFQTSNQGDTIHMFVKPIEPTTYGGQALQLQRLPTSLKTQARDMINSIIDIPGARELTSLLSTKHDLVWLDYFKKLDEIRGTNWRHSLSHPLVDYDN